MFPSSRSQAEGADHVTIVDVSRLPVYTSFTPGQVIIGGVLGNIFRSGIRKAKSKFCDKVLYKNALRYKVGLYINMNSERTFQSIIIKFIFKLTDPRSLKSSTKRYRRETKCY